MIRKNKIGPRQLYEAGWHELDRIAGKPRKWYKGEWVKFPGPPDSQEFLFIGSPVYQLISNKSGYPKIYNVKTMNDINRLIQIGGE